jgi:hypothetical protein
VCGDIIACRQPHIIMTCDVVEGPSGHGGKTPKASALSVWRDDATAIWNEDGSSEVCSHLDRRRNQMRANFPVTVLLASAVCVPAFAQSNPPATAPAPSATTTTTSSSADSKWRASKLVGVDVYNDQNERLGEIDEVLIDPSGRVAGIVIGVGGFLGMGERNVAVAFDKLKFVNEPRQTTTTTTTRPAPTTGAADRPATTTTTATPRTDEHKWQPNHAILSGATKDSLKNMTEFKYN